MSEPHDETAAATGAGPTGPRALLEALRPSHWIKNAFVVAPILFARRYDEPAAWGFSLAAAGAFCLLSSGVYLLNDVLDRRADRAHPAKRNRPVASGRLSPATAALAGALLLAAGLAGCGAVAWPNLSADAPLRGAGVAVWGGAYVVLNLLYSVWLKRKVIVDVLVVALGFVLRAMAGAAALAVPVSPWLVLCTFTLCLFIAVAKRRSEVLELPSDQAGRTRAVSRTYRPQDLEHMLTVSTALALLTYSLYCLAPGTIARVGSAHMVWTIPLVTYGLFRYYILTRSPGRGDPVGLLLRDRALWLTLIAYVAVTLAVYRFGPAHKDLFVQ